MPTLGHLTCTILLPPTDTPLPTYKHTYLDSSVSAYIPVPNIPILHAAPSFNIQLRSDAWLAPGLAIFVFIDGVYQCNRSKPAPPLGTPGGCAVEIRVRQREEKIAGPRGQGEFVGREWRWVELDAGNVNEQLKMSKEQQEDVGEITVVVLRCDYDEVEPRRVHPPDPAGNATEKPHSIKAPSAKASSTKAPASKAPSGDADPLGGMFGLFDGAMDYNLDGAGESRPAGRQNEYRGTQLDANNRRYKRARHGFAHTEAFTSHQQAGQQAHFPRLDGQDYDHPGVVVNQYGQVYDPRTPYTGHRRFHSNYDDSRPQMYQAPVATPQEFVPAPRGQQYANQRPVFAPAYQGQQAPYPQSPQQLRPQYVPIPQAQAHPGQRGRDGPAYGYPTYVGQARNNKYIPPGQPAPGQQQPRYYPTPADAYFGPPAIDTEYQRFQIFRRARRYSELFKAEHGLLAAAVPHILLLRDVLVDDLTLSQIEQVRRELKSFIDAGHFPNGEKVRPLVGPFEAANKTTGQGASSTSGSKWNNGSQKGDSSKKEGNQSGENIGNAWSPWGADNNAQSGSQKSNKSSSSVDHFGGGNKSQSGSKKSESGSKKSESGSKKDDGGANANDGDKQNDSEGSEWPGNTPNQDGNQEQGPDWNNNNGNQNQTNNNFQPTANENQNATNNWATNPSPPQNNTFNPPPPSKPPSSRHSTTSTSPSATTNPHAHIKPYFTTWRTAPQTPTKTPLRPRPREPYTYPAAPASHLSASQVGDRSHGVRMGRGADYLHNTQRPRYLDSMERPFAVFVFKYRSAEKLGEILGRDVGGDLKAVEQEVGKGVLLGMPKERLVEELMRMQEDAAAATAGGGGHGGTAAASPPTAAAPANNTFQQQDSWKAASVNKSNNGVQQQTNENQTKSPVNLWNDGKAASATKQQSNNNNGGGGFAQTGEGQVNNTWNGGDNANPAAKAAGGPW